MLDIGIIIVNWNTRDLLRDCLRSLRDGHMSVSRRVIVVDNASSDGSAGMVRAEYPAVEVIENPVNGGFSQANNLGIKALGPLNDLSVRYVLLLNPDTVVPPDGLCKMIARMDADPSIGAAGPRLILRDGS
ncbi:MAG TPA: glycosyltransferase family 2 protein, partial [Aggregatilineales bacterium]|nr:glycosyltransferase family 2 protein [Aggregatilineales bacterium]